LVPIIPPQAFLSFPDLFLIFRDFFGFPSLFPRYSNGMMPSKRPYFFLPYLLVRQSFVAFGASEFFPQLRFPYGLLFFPLNLAIHKVPILFIGGGAFPYSYLTFSNLIFLGFIRSDLMLRSGQFLQLRLFIHRGFFRRQSVFPLASPYTPREGTAFTFLPSLFVVVLLIKPPLLRLRS